MSGPGGYATLGAVAEALRGETVSSVALVDDALGRIAALNPRIHALSEVLGESARAAARRSDERRAAGSRLHDVAGVPVAVKDLIDTTPAVCSAGLPFLRDYRPARDAPVVRRLRRAGAVVVGVTETDPGAFATRTPQTTHSQAPALTVGGSSGGSGAALAAGLCFAALGTDTGGSIRVPAACCMITGLMPTFGRVPTEGVRPLVWSLDHVGPLTRRAADLAAVARVIDTGFERTRRRKPGAPVVIGHDPAYYDDADEAVKRGFKQALDACGTLGATFREVSLPRPGDVMEIHLAIFSAEAAAYHLATFPEHRDEYQELARLSFDFAEKQTGMDYVRSTRRRAELTAQVDAALRDVDFLLAPTLPVLTPARDAAEVKIGGKSHEFTLGLVYYTCLFDHTGHPVVAMPASVEGPGMGASVQIVAPRNRDADAVAFAERLEAALDLDIDFTVRIGELESG